jgi:2-oxoglutarate ferredoxin oxidoreductase subunit gamma
MGNSRIANMVLIGAMLEIVNVIPLDIVKQALDEHIPERNRKYLPMNFEALDKGAEFARQFLAETA